MSLRSGRVWTPPFVESRHIAISIVGIQHTCTCSYVHVQYSPSSSVALVQILLSSHLHAVLSWIVVLYSLWTHADKSILVRLGLSYMHVFEHMTLQPAASLLCTAFCCMTCCIHYTASPLATCCCHNCYGNCLLYLKRHISVYVRQ